MAKTTKSPCKLVNKDKSQKLLLVAKIGRAVGLSGGLKLHILNDFPHIFKPKAIFHTHSKIYPCLEILSFSSGIVHFVGFGSRESASGLVNTELYSTIEESREMCGLRDSEFLWEEIIGASVRDCTDLGCESEILGIINDIERIGEIEYLCVKTNDELVKNGFARTFLVPYIKQYVISLSAKEVCTINAKLILEES